MRAEINRTVDPRRRGDRLGQVTESEIIGREAGGWTDGKPRFFRLPLDKHIEKALADHGAETRFQADPVASIVRLEGRLKQFRRAEEILLERFGRGFITDSALDKELVRLKTDRTTVEQAIAAARRGAGSRDDSARTAAELRKNVSELRDRLRLATPEDRRDIVRAIVAKGELGVTIGPDRIEVEILLAG